MHGFESFYASKAPAECCLLAAEGSCSMAPSGVEGAVATGQPNDSGATTLLQAALPRSVLTEDINLPNKESFATITALRVNLLSLSNSNTIWTRDAHVYVNSKSVLQHQATYILRNDRQRMSTLVVAPGC